MERLYGVLAERGDELVGLLADLRGYDGEIARRFVTVAGADLIHSFAWQCTELDVGDLTAFSNITRLLGGMHARRIARTLGLPIEDVWAGLRAFVPEVLSLASRRGRRTTGTTSQRVLYVGPYPGDRSGPTVTPPHPG